MPTATLDDDLRSIGASIGGELRDLQGVVRAISYGWTPEDAIALYGWTAGQSKTNKVMAIGNGAQAGQKLYGERAEAALRAQQRLQNGPQAPTKKQRAEADAGTRRREKAASAETAKRAAEKAIADPKSLSGADLSALGQHLKTLTVAQLKKFSADIKGKVSGNKEALAARLHNYVKTQSSKKPEPKPGDAPEPKAAEKPPAIDYRHKDANHPLAKAIAGDAKAKAVMDKVWGKANVAVKQKAELQKLEEDRSALFGKWNDLDTPPRPPGANASAPERAEYDLKLKEWAKQSKARSDAWKEYMKAAGAETAAREAWQKSADEMRPALEAALKHDTPAAFKSAVTAVDQDMIFKGLDWENPAVKEIVNEGERFVKGVCAHLGTLDVVYGSSADGRAFASRNAGGAGRHFVALGPLPDANQIGKEFWIKNSQQTQIHELGHTIEYHKPGVDKLATDFIAYRCGDEKPVKLKDMFPDSSYGDEEVGRKDDFGRAFGTDGAAAYYVGKVYESGSTEVVSMGLEKLYADPAGFIAADPEYAQFIFKVLTMGGE